MATPRGIMGPACHASDDANAGVPVRSRCAPTQKTLHILMPVPYVPTPHPTGQIAAPLQPPAKLPNIGVCQAVPITHQSNLASIVLLSPKHRARLNPPKCVDQKSAEVRSRQQLILRRPSQLGRYDPPPIIRRPMLTP